MIGTFGTCSLCKVASHSEQFAFCQSALTYCLHSPTSSVCRHPASHQRQQSPPVAEEIIHASWTRTTVWYSEMNTAFPKLCIEKYSVKNARMHLSSGVRYKWENWVAWSIFGNAASLSQYQKLHRNQKSAEQTILCAYQHKVSSQTTRNFYCMFPTDFL